MNDEEDQRALQEEQRQDRLRAEMDLRDVIEGLQRDHKIDDDTAHFLKWGCGIQQRAR